MTLSPHLHTVCLAPMLKTTDRHFRYLMRLLSRHLFVYTEMITASALLHGDRNRFLMFDESEHPVAIQLGGCDPKDLALSAKMAEDAGFDEVNLNVGCPSPRVQSGNFGACLMKSPELVTECVAAMNAVVNIPVTVKMRTGIGREADYDYLHQFISMVSKEGCPLFIIHARNVWFDIKMPKENRQKPTIRYEMVYQVKKDFPDLEIIVNGDIESAESGLAHLDHVNGIMLGRLAFHDPYQFSQIDKLYYHDNHPVPTREAIVEQYIEYMEIQLAKNEPLRRMTRHLLNLYTGQPRANLWRRNLTVGAEQRSAQQKRQKRGDVEVVREALEFLIQHSE